MKRIAAACATVALLSGCASIVSDNDSATYIQTEPEVARCELHGQDFKRVVSTPTSIQLPAAAAPLTVACKADGYRTTTEKLDTSMDGWIIGNLIFGGVIGVVVDAARGAGQKYPPQFSVILEPELFRDDSDRDAWYDVRKEKIIAKWDKVVASIRNQCNSSTAGSNCDGQLVEAERKRTEELRQIEDRRAKATIGA